MKIKQHLQHDGCLINVMKHLVAGSLCFSLISLVTGCPDASNQSASSSTDSQIAASRMVHTYVVRGKVAQVPVAGKPQSELRIHHEAISDFKNQQGQVSPMPAMEMPFDIAKDVSLQGIAPGDIVEFTLEVQWRPSSGAWITAIRKLPQETRLKVGR